mgnify:CR=1 FL=1
MCIRDRSSATVPVEQLHITLPDFHAGAFRLAQFEQAVNTSGKERKQLAQELIENIKDKRMELRLKVLELQTLFDISLSLNSVLDIEELSSEVLIRSVSTLNASSGFILKTQKNSPILSVLSSFNVDEAQLKSAIFSKSSLPFKSVWKLSLIHI